MIAARFNDGNAASLPGTPEEGLPRRQCARCPATGNAHQGVEMPSGRWICARCYRRPIIGSARKKR